MTATLPAPETESKSRHSLRRTAAWACMVGTLIAGAPGAARALTVTSATITSHPVKGDGFTIKGELDASDPAGLDLGAASGVVFELDGIVAGLQGTDFKRGKTRLTYRGPSRSPGLAQLTIDLKKRRFTAKGSGILIPGLPGPLTVRVRANDALGCAVLPLVRLGSPPKKPPTKPTTTRYGLPKKQTSVPCLLAGRLHAAPTAIVVSTPTSVRFEASLAAGLVPDPGGARVRRLANGVPTGAPLCTLVDDGGPASGDLIAGDGLRDCTVTITDDTLGTDRVAVEATIAGVTLVSPPLDVPVVAPFTDADLDTMFAAQTSAREIWDAEVAALGDTVNARVAAIRQIAALPGVADVRLSADGLDIAIRFTSGHSGGLLLSTRFGDISAQSATRAAATAGNGIDATAAAAGPPPSARGLVHQCPVEPDRTKIGNHDVLLLTTSYFGPNDDWPIARAGFKGSCLPLAPVKTTLTLASILSVTSYGAVFMSTHGYVDGDGEVIIVTDQTATKAEVDKQGPNYDPYSKDEFFIIGLPAAVYGGGRNVWVVRPAYLRRLSGQLDNGFVYASHCHSYEDPSEAAAFLDHGAKTFFGYDGTTSNYFAALVTGSLIPDLAQHLLTTGEAFDRCIKNDPNPVLHDPLSKGLGRVLVGGATFHWSGIRDLSYVGETTMTPTAPTIRSGESVEFTSDVDGEGDCHLVNRWTSTLDAGQDISDGMGDEGSSFDTPATTITYQSRDGGLGTDQVTVAIVPPGDATGLPLLGGACGNVEVQGCGDGVVNGGEQCDGTDDAACPGLCQADCSCGQASTCGDNVVEFGEVCDGTDRAICDTLSPHGVGYCHPDCQSCGQCGDGVVDPNEECDPQDDSPCPGACRNDCTCGCAPGDSAGCPSDKCCDPNTKSCCAPVRNGSDPACFATASGCCGGLNLQPNFCGGPGPSVCPDTNCAGGGFYYCWFCDNKLVQGICSSPTSCP